VRRVLDLEVLANVAAVQFGNCQLVGLMGFIFTHIFVSVFRWSVWNFGICLWETWLVCFFEL